MFLLILYTQKQLNGWMLLFTAACFIIGVATEIVGVKTGGLFGDFEFGKVLGPSIETVPYVIGINWFIIIYCTGITIHILLSNILDRIATDTNTVRPSLKAMSVVVDGATLAVLFNWLIEPVAVKLGYWKWTTTPDGGAPFYNHLCWFIVSSLLLLVFHYARFEKQNKFAINLLLVQAMYFLLLRTFL